MAYDRDVDVLGALGVADRAGDTGDRHAYGGSLLLCQVRKAERMPFRLDEDVVTVAHPDELVLVDRPAGRRLVAAVLAADEAVRFGRACHSSEFWSNHDRWEDEMADVAKVITIIGSSPESFAKAADAAVQEAAKTVRGISGAHVVSMSALVEGERITMYRTTVDIAFAIER
jgi:flavin-binding protein dodecin